ncbi:hypothetical protein LCGC14_1259630, partial [marine sediment metagenome]
QYLDRIHRQTLRIQRCDTERMPKGAGTTPNHTPIKEPIQIYDLQELK